MSRERRQGKFILLQTLKEGQRRGVNKKRREKLTRSKDPVLWLGVGERRHVDEYVWECGATDQWVTLQKKSTVGIR